MIWVLRLIGMFENIEQVTALDMKNHLLKGHLSFAFQLFIFLSIPKKVFHVRNVIQCVPNVNFPVSPFFISPVCLI